MILGAFALLAALTACGAPRTTATPVPAPVPVSPEAIADGAPSSPALPPVPLVTGRLAPRVVYPSANAVIQ